MLKFANGPSSAESAGLYIYKKQQLILMGIICGARPVCVLTAGPVKYAIRKRFAGLMVKANVLNTFWSIIAGHIS